MPLSTGSRKLKSSVSLRKDATKNLPDNGIDEANEEIVKPKVVPQTDEYPSVLPARSVKLAWTSKNELVETSENAGSRRPSTVSTGVFRPESLLTPPASSEESVPPEPEPEARSPTPVVKTETTEDKEHKTSHIEEDVELHDDDDDVAVVTEELLDDTENARVVEELRQPNNCNVAVVPPRATAFQAPCITLPRPKEGEPEPSDDEDGMSFCFYPQGTHATEVTFTVEPKRTPQWLNMMRCGFVPIMNCAVPPCCLPERGRRNGAYIVNGSSSSSSGSSSSSSASSSSGCDSDSDGDGSNDSDSSSQGSKNADETSADEEEEEEDIDDPETEDLHSNVANSFKPVYGSHPINHVNSMYQGGSHNSMYGNMHQPMYQGMHHGDMRKHMHQSMQRGSSWNDMYHPHQHQKQHHMPHHAHHHGQGHGHHYGHYPGQHLQHHSAAGTGKEAEDATSDEESNEDEEIEAAQIGPVKSGDLDVGSTVKNKLTEVKSILKKNTKKQEKDSSSSGGSDDSSSGGNDDT